MPEQRNESSAANWQYDPILGWHQHTESAATNRELRLRTIKGLRELLREGTAPSPAVDGLSVESNGYGLWLVPYDPQPMSTAPISDEEILRRIEAREALADAS